MQVRGITQAAAGVAVLLTLIWVVLSLSRERTLRLADPLHPDQAAGRPEEQPPDPRLAHKQDKWEAPAPTFRGNLQRTGFYRTKGIEAVHQVRTSQPKRAYGPPAFDGDSVYFSYSDGLLCAVDASSGRGLWK